MQLRFDGKGVTDRDARAGQETFQQVQALGAQALFIHAVVTQARYANFSIRLQGQAVDSCLGGGSASLQMSGNVDG